MSNKIKDELQRIHEANRKLDMRLKPSEVKKINEGTLTPGISGIRPTRTFIDEGSGHDRGVHTYVLPNGDLQVTYAGRSIKLDAAYMTAKNVDEVISRFVRDVDTGPVMSADLDNLKDYLLHKMKNEMMDMLDQSSLINKVNDLVKRTAALESRPNWDPHINRIDKLLEDQATWVSDEEMLAEDYRGWPTPKERIVF